MIRALRRRFVLVVSASLLAVMLVLLAALNVMNWNRVLRSLDDRLLILAENGGQFPEQPPADNPDITAETKYETRYFVIKRNPDDPEEQRVNMDNIASITNGDAIEYMSQVTRSGRAFGFCGSYRYYVAQTDSENSEVIFLYCHRELRACLSLLGSTALVGLGCYGAVLLLVALLAGRAVRPFEQGVQRQKQFISDAGHEIKTPLGIIAANNSLLSDELGENRWLDSSSRQLERLRGLVEDMLALTALDEGRRGPEPEVFSLTDAILDTAADFGARAGMAGMSISTRAEELSALGDEAAVRKLLGILLDNAIKYSDPGATIDVALARRGRRAIITVENPCSLLPDEGLERLFDRFYRADGSRSRQSGCGLGLSIARKLCEAGGGSLTAKSPSNGRVQFIAELPGVK